MNKFLLNKILFAITSGTLILITVLLYFYKLDVIPSGLYVDEAVSGYNSYSLLKTGKDEYGKAFPIALRYFASYSPPLYAYASIFPIHFFDLSVFSIRFLGALSGILSVLLAYLFIKHLNIFQNNYQRLMGAFLFAISPWVILYSRLGYEVYFAVVIFILGAYFFAKALTSPKYILLGVFFLSLSAYASHTQKYLLIIWVPLYFFIFHKELNLQKNYQVILTSLGLGLFLLSPLLLLLNTEASFSKNNLFYSQAIVNRAEAYFLPSFISVPIATTFEFLARYMTYFSPKSLFFLGDPDLQRSLPEISVFFSWMVLPYLIGLFLLLTRLKETGYKYLLFLLLVSPIPASLTQDPFSTQRALPVFFPIFLVITLGVSKILEGNLIIKSLLVFVIFIYSPFMLWRSYFVLFPIERAAVWGFGSAQLVQEIRSKPDTNFVIDQSRLKPFYIEYAFHTHFEPEKMQQLYPPDFLDNYYNQTEFNPPKKLSNVEFRPVVWETDICKKQILVGDDLSFSENNVKEHFLSLEFTITDPRGNVLFKGYRTSPELKCLKRS